MSESSLFDQIPANISTSQSVVVGPGPSGIGSNTGFVNFGFDHDWFRVNLRPGELYQFQLNSTSTLDPTLTLRNSVGTQLAFNDDSGGTLNSLLTYQSSGGTFYLDAGGFSSSTGSYSIVAREVPGSASTYASVGVNASTTGDIQDANDQDWYNINLVAGQSYIFDARGTTLSDPTLVLHNAAGAQLAFNDDGGPGLNSRIEFTAATSGRYFLDVGGFSSLTGGYNLSTRIDDVSDDNNSIDTVAVGGSRAGVVNSAADQDWFGINLVAGQSYIFDATGTTLSDPTLTLHNAAGTQLAFNDDGGPGLNSRIEFTAATSGTYFLDVGGFSSLTGGYNLSTRIDDVSDDNNSIDTVAVGGSRAGVVNSAADQDWFGINLVAGQSYIFDATGTTLSDPTLTLHNAAGTQLAFNDDGGPGLNSRIEFTAATSGTYFLDVGGFSSLTGGYNLSTRIDDVSDDNNSIDTVAVGGSRAGVVNSAADQDWFGINLVAGQSYIFDATGTTLSDPTLTLHNAAGTQLAFNDDGGPGLNSRIEFTAATSGTYFLDVGGFSSLTGGYNLSTRIDDVSDDNNSIDTVAVGGSRAGVVNSAADQDWFGINLVAGQSYIFDATGTTLSDPTLTLHNAAGTQLAFNDDGGPGLNSRIEFTAATSGTYFLDVGGFSSLTGGYNLSTRIDDVSDDVNTIDSIAANGSRSGAINSVNDQDWYSIAMTAGQSLTFDAIGGTLSDPTLAVRNSAGTQLAFNDDFGGSLNSHISFAAPSTGTYFLDVGGFGANTGTYLLFG